MSRRAAAPVGPHWKGRPLRHAGVLDLLNEALAEVVIVPRGQDHRAAMTRGGFRPRGRAALCRPAGQWAY